jgi:hypothetical protein
MSNEQKRIRIELTSEQQALVKERTGIEVPSVELTAEELEDRIAPLSLNYASIGHTYTQQG